MSQVEVINDYTGPGVVNLVRYIRYHPERLLAALMSSSTTQEDPDLERACSCYQRLIEQWYCHGFDPGRVPASVDELYSTFYAPYQRMKTVIWESREWLACMKTYDDPRAVQIIEPPWQADEWDLFAALALQLHSARCQWIVSVPNTTRLQSLFFPLAHPHFICEDEQAGTMLLTNFPSAGEGKPARS